jgi:hypothetical protein
MPVKWMVYPGERLMIAVAEGDVTRADMEGYLDAQISSGAISYRKIFDGSRGDTSMGPEDLLALGVRIRSMQTDAMGPLAVVVPDDKEKLLGRLFGMLAVPDRPMRIFNDPVRARRWIEKQLVDPGD